MDDQPAPMALATELPRPMRGGSTRVQCGSYEAVLEAPRGGHALVWSNGQEARRFALGLGDVEQLALVLRAPRLPVRIVPRDVIVLAPRGRLRGYVQLPLVPTLVARSANGREQTLLELPTRELAAEWDEQSGTSFRFASAWHVRFPMRSGEPRAIVPAWLANPGDDVVCPGPVPIHLEDGELGVLRGTVVAAPRRFVWDGRMFVTSVVSRRVGALR